MLPLCKPLVAVLTLLTLSSEWNSFAWPLVALFGNQQLFTLPIGMVTDLQSQYTSDYGAIMAMTLSDDRPDGGALRGVPAVLHRGSGPERHQVTIAGSAALPQHPRLLAPTGSTLCARAVPGLDVRQVTAEKAEDVPDDVWATVDVLHTSTVFPDPAVAPRLRWVQLDTSGIDHVQRSPLWASSVDITTIGGISPVPLAEYVMFGVLGLAHRLPAMLEVQSSRTWPNPSLRWDRFLPARVDGSTMAILGYGRLGREIGRLARAHGMTVVGVTRTARRRTEDELSLLADFGRSPTPQVPSTTSRWSGPTGCTRCCGRADWVVVVLPLTPQTAGRSGRPPSQP